MRSLGDTAKLRTFSRLGKNSGKANFACNLLNLRAKSIKMKENNICRVFKLFLQLYVLKHLFATSAIF